MARTITIRRSLLWNIIAVIVLFGAAVFATTFIGRERAFREISESVIGHTLDHAETQLHRMLDPVIADLLLTRQWGQSGLLDLDHDESLHRLAGPLIDQRLLISSAMLADEHGNEYMLLESDGNWQNRVTRPDTHDGRVQWREWTDANPTPRIRMEPLDYDPRDRPWYIGAVERHREIANTQTGIGRDDVFWTKPYAFFTTGEPGITASVAYHNPAGILQVLALDIRLDDISKLTMGFEVGERGLVIVGGDEGKVIGLPRDARFEDPVARTAAFLKTPSELGIDVATDAAKAYAKRPLNGDEPNLFPFRCHGERWWGKAKRFTLGNDRSLWISVLAPENELLGNIARFRVYIAGITLFALAAGVIRSVVFARHFSQPLELLVNENERISHGDLEPRDRTMSPLLEVNRLAEAQDRMREALRSLTKLEHDLQLARQIQQDTFPTMLPTLEGFDIAAYGEPAEQTGGDSYDVIGYNGSLHGEPVHITINHAQQAMLMLADATGHGIGPALLVTQIRAMLRMAVRNGEPFERFIPQLNAQLAADLPNDRFITSWLGILDSQQRTLRWFSAGQGPILHYHAAEDRCDVHLADTVPFGIMDDMEIVPREPIPLPVNDIFAVLSDGIFEADNAANIQLGTEPVIEIIRQHRDKSAQEILQAIRQLVAEYTQQAPAEDDRTAILIKSC